MTLDYFCINDTSFNQSHSSFMETHIVILVSYHSISNVLSSIKLCLNMPGGLAAAAQRGRRQLQRVPHGKELDLGEGS